MITSRTKASYLAVVSMIINVTLLTLLYDSPSTSQWTMNASGILALRRYYDPAPSPSPRICCLIVTAPQYLPTRAKAVNDTWGPRCDRYFFVSELPRGSMTQEQIQIADRLPIAPIPNITSGYGHLTQKSTLALLFVYEKHRNACDWFVKADDDTYLIVDHLKTFLSKRNTSEPVTYGYNFKIVLEKGYHSGGAAYVLGREALQRFHDAHHDPKSSCAKDGGSEDVEIAKCLATKGVYPGNSLDEQNREIFHPLSFIRHFRHPPEGWLFGYSQNVPQSGYNCCSVRSVSFHYASPEEQYLMDYLLYRIKPLLTSKATTVT